MLQFVLQLTMWISLVIIMNIFILFSSSKKYSDFKFCAVALVDPAGSECCLSQTELKPGPITTKQRITGSSLNKEAIHKIMFWMESVCISADMKSIRYLWLTADVMQYFHSVTL